MPDFAPGHPALEGLTPKKKKKKKGTLPSGRPIPQAPPPKVHPTYEVPEPQVDDAVSRGLQTLEFPGIAQPAKSNEYYRNIPTPAYRPQPVDAQIDAIVSAYRKLNGGKYPSPAKLAMLLTTTPPSTTEEQYAQLLNPIGLVKRPELMWTDPRVIEAEAMRPHVDDISGDFDPSDDVRTAFSPSYSPTSASGDWSSEDPDPLKALRLMRSKRLIHESMDVDKTEYDRALHDLMLSDVRSMKQNLGLRITEYQKVLGDFSGLDFDASSDEYDFNTDRAYRLYAAAPVLVRYVLGDVKEKQKAAEILGIVGMDENGNPSMDTKEGLIFDLYGNDAGKVKAELLHLSDSLSTATDQERVGKLLYDLYQFGRPFGQSERARRMDFASQWPDMVPVEEAEKVAEDTWTVGRVLNLPFEIIPVVKDLHDKNGNPAAGVLLDAINTPLQGVEKTFEALGAVVGYTNQAVSSIFNLALLSDGYHTLDENGQVVMKPELVGNIRKGTNYGKARQQGLVDTPGGGYTTPPLDLSVWKNVPLMVKDLATGEPNAIWESARGKAAVVEAAKWMGLATVGQDPNEVAPLEFLITLAQFGTDLKMMSVLDKGGRKIIKSRLKSDWRTGRQAWAADHPEDWSIQRYGLVKLAESGWNSLKPIKDRYNQTGTWVLHVPKKVIEGLPEKSRGRVNDLLEEADSIQSDLASQSYRDYAPEAEAVSPDVAMDYRSVKQYILARNGITRESTTLGPESDTHGLVKPEKVRGGKPKPIEKRPRGLDVVIDEMKAENPGLPFNDVNTFWQWMDAQKAAPKGRARTSKAVVGPMDRLKQIEDELATELQANGIRATTGTIDAPEALFDRSEVIGEGKQAGLDIAIDETARKTEPFAAPPEKGPAEMPGQTEMPTETSRAEIHAIKLKQAEAYIEKTQRDLENYHLEVVDGRVVDSDFTRPFAGEKRLGSTKEARSGTAALNDLMGRKRVGEIAQMQKQYDRAQERLAEAQRPLETDNVVPLRPTTAPDGSKQAFDKHYRYKQDNPVEKGMPDAEQWIEQNPHAMTASYRDDILMDPAKLKELPGELGEEARMGEATEVGRIDKLAAKMAADGWQGEAISVRIYADGRAVIMEGNHRVRAAERAGLRDVPVEVRYFGGGEMKTSFNPMDYIPDRLIDRFTPTTAPDGVKVTPVEVGAEKPAMVDAGISESVQWQVENGYKPYQSHSGLKEDHPAGTNARKAEPYIEYLKSENPANLIGRIKSAAKKLGYEVEEGKVDTPKGKRSNLLVRGDVNALTAELRKWSEIPEGKGIAETPARGGVPAQAPPGGELSPPLGSAPPTAGLPIVRRKMPWFLRNTAEVIAYQIKPEGVGETVITELLGLPTTGDPVLHAQHVALIERLKKTDDPYEVADIIVEAERLHPELEIDPSGVGMLQSVRLTAEEVHAQGFLPDFVRVVTNRVHLDRSVDPIETHKDIMSYGRSVKMGELEYTPKAAARSRWWADQIWKEVDPFEKKLLIDKMDVEIVNNMKANGLWVKAIAFQHNLRKARKMDYSRVQSARRRAYGFDDRVTTDTVEKVYGDRSRYQRRLEEGVKTETDKQRLRASIKEADRYLDEVTKAHKTIDELEGKKTRTRDEERRLDDAWQMFDSFGSHQPILTSQLRTHIAHDVIVDGHTVIDPRTLAIFQSGKAARFLERANAARWNLLFGDSIMRVWKSIVMASLGFPIRVNVGDEAMRLFSEGIITGGGLKDARATARDMFGGKTTSGVLAGKMTFGKWDRGYRNITQAQTAELHRLEAKKELTPAEMERKADLQQRTRGWMDEEISDQLFDKANNDLADYGTMSGEYVHRWAGSGDPNTLGAVQDFYRKVADEPIFKEMKRQNIDATLPREELETWIEDEIRREVSMGELVVGSRGYTVESLMERTGRMSEGTLDPYELRKLVENYADIVEFSSRDNRLTAALRGARVSKGELGKVDWDMVDPQGAFRVPVNIAGELSTTKGMRTPFHYVYDKATMPMLTHFTGRLRETFFSSKFIEEHRRLTRNARERGSEVSPEDITEAAARRALAYTNKVTFTRSPTIFEDVNRNILPFINSYRQFALYWMKTFTKYPITMTTAYNENPLSEEQFGQTNIGGWVYSTPISWLMPFWMQSEFGTGQRGGAQVIKQGIVAVNPHISAASAWALSFGTKEDISTYPGMESADPASAPYKRIGNLLWSVWGTDLNVIKPLGKTVYIFGDDVEKLEKAQLENLRGMRRYVTDNGETKVVYDEPWGYRFLKSIGIQDPVMFTKELTRTGGSTVTATPEVTSEIKAGKAQMFKLTTDEARAKYRADHPIFDDYLKLTEDATRKEQVAIFKRRPELVSFYPGLYQSTDPNETTTFSYDAFVEKKEGGKFPLKTLQKDEQDGMALWVKLYGGVPSPTKRSEVGIYYGGDIARAEAVKVFNASIKRATEYARLAAKDIVKSDHKSEFKQLMDQWRRTTSKRRVGPMGEGDYVLPPVFAEWARKHDVEPNELNPGWLTDNFQVTQGWGSDPKFDPSGMSDEDARVINGLKESGVVLPAMIEGLIKNSRFEKDIRAESDQHKVDARKSLYDIKELESFKLDSVDLIGMGYHAGKAFDKAQEDVRKFYHSPGGWFEIREKFGANTSEDRDARNRFYAFRDKRMKGVPGGEAVTGGLTKTMMLDKYFTSPNGTVTFGVGPKAKEQEQAWKMYLREMKKPNPDMAQVRRFRSVMGKQFKDKLHERQRVIDWVYAIATAQNIRYEMKTSYSEFYEGPGNSVYSKEGQKKVAELEKLLKGMYTDDNGEVEEKSPFYKDVKEYFGNEHTLAYRMLEWYYH